MRLYLPPPYHLERWNGFYSNVVVLPGTAPRAGDVYHARFLAVQARLRSVKNMVMGLSACIEDIVGVYLSGGRWQVLYICHQSIKPCSRLPRGCLTNYIQHEARQNGHNTRPQASIAHRHLIGGRYVYTGMEGG